MAEIASGGMATVYLARAIGLVDFRRFFAIKRLHPHLNGDPDFVAMFLDEARLAARIHHPNVVPIFEIGVKDEQYFLVMDYVEGDTASRIIVRSKHLGRTIPIGFTTRVLVETLAGLHAAHELTGDDGRVLEIVHRDVSPQNILIGVDGVARITDFGVARAAARIGDRTQGGQLKGKLAYMAPEQIRGGRVDRRVDIFAAGIVLWEMLAGERLFKAETDGETLFKVAAAEVRDLTTLVPSIPPAIAAVCHRALAKEPGDRYATAADFGDALESAARASGLMFTARESATFVHELVGQDVTAHRDLVRTWLTASDVSRSGVALARPLSPPLAPPMDAPESGSHPTPPTPPAPVALSNLASDHEELATRIDVPIEEVALEGAMSSTNPAPPPATPPAHPVIPPPATVPDFGASYSPVAATTAPIAAPPPPAPIAPARAPSAGVSPWLLAIPLGLVLVVGGGVAVWKLRGGEASPAVSTSTKAVTTSAPIAPSADTTLATVATTTTTAPPSAIPTVTTTASATPTPTVATTTTTPTVATTTAAATVAAKPTTLPTASVRKPKPIDNSAFGGRK